MKTWKAGGLELSNPLMVGAGVCKTPEQVLVYQGDVPAGAVVTGSYTLKQRDGNSGTTTWPVKVDSPDDLMYCLNSLNMPNCGIDDVTGRLNAISSGVKKPLVVSFAGFSPKEFLVPIERSSRLRYVNVRAIELNFGCPNTSEHGGGVTMSYDIRGISEVIAGIAAMKSHLPVWLKFSPYHHQDHFHLLDEVAAVINDHGDTISAVVTCNTLPNVSIQYAGKTLTTPNNGYAGLSGRILKTISLRDIGRFRKKLASNIDVIGVGGITNGKDVLDILNQGGAAAQAVSLPVWCGGPRALQDLLLGNEEYQEYLAS